MSDFNNFGLHTCSTTREYQKCFQNSFLVLNRNKCMTDTHPSVAQRKKLMEVYLGSSLAYWLAFQHCIQGFSSPNLRATLYLSYLFKNATSVDITKYINIYPQDNFRQIMLTCLIHSW